MKGSKPKRTKAEQRRLLIAAGVGALAMLFAALNFDEVDVNWLFGTWSTPLIIVIVVAFVLGLGLGLLLGRRTRSPATTSAPERQGPSHGLAD